MSGTSDIGPFSIVPRWVMDACKGKPSAVALYACLADHADRTNDDGWTIGRQELADETGSSLSTVDRMTKHLEAVEAVEVTRQTHNGEKTWSRYVIRFAMPGVASKRSKVASKRTLGAVNLTHSPIEPLIKTPSASSAKKPQPPERVEAERLVREWWDARKTKPAQSFIGIVKIVERMLSNDWDPKVAARALREVPTVTGPAIDFWLAKHTKLALPTIKSSPKDPNWFIAELEDGFRRNTMTGELWNPNRDRWEPDPEWLYQEQRKPQ